MHNYETIIFFSFCMKFKLLTTNEVCEMLGISRSTLYRWNNLADPDVTPLISVMDKISSSLEENYNNFPKPFKIGRVYKWREDEILEWLETTRVK